MSDRSSYQFPFASYPAIRLVLLLGTGIAIDYHYRLSLFCWISLITLLALIFGISEFIQRHRLKATAYNFSILSYLLLIMTFGGTWHSLFDNRKPPVSARVLNAYTWQKLLFSGEVQQIKQTSTGKYQLDVAVDTTFFEKNLPWPKAFMLRAVLDPQKQQLPKKLILGSHILFRAEIYPLEGPRNPHEFDYKSYLASQNIYAQAGLKKILSIESGAALISWAKIRQKVLAAIDNNFSEATAPLAKALLIGYKNELGREEKIAFSRAGLSHIMAVSGLHVGFILAPFWLLIPFFWTMKYGKQIGLALLLGILFFYAGLTGFSASVTRASLAGGFLMYGRLFHKVRDAKNLTAVAALIILVINPNELFSIGFQLSFGAVYLILLITPVLYRGLPYWLKYRWYGKPLMIIIISFIVQLGLFPLLAYYFGEFSVVGPLANAFVIPFLGLAVPFALLLLPLTLIAPGAARMLNTPVDYFLNSLNHFVAVTSTWDWSWMQVHIDSLLFFAIWVAVILFIASLRVAKIRWNILSLLLILLCANQFTKIAHKLSPGNLKITFFDVGQGDAALVRTPANKHFLVDTGIWQPHYNSAKYILLPYLKAEGIKKLDAIFLSHPHADHIGGMPELIDHIPIDTIYNSGSSYDSKLFKTYLQKAKKKHIPVVSLSAGDEVNIDPLVKLFIYGPDPRTSNKNVNNHSLILEVNYEESEFLFMGDAEALQEKKLIEDYPKLADTDFLKVGHHGSKTSSQTYLLDDITAKKGVVSLALQNKFSHPNPEAIRRLQNHAIQLHFTSLEGALQFYSDGKTIYRIKE